MPSSTIVSDFAPRITAATTMMAVASAADNHAMSARLNCGWARSCQRNTMALAPPKAAAAEMPRVKGSASGLSRMVCICAPASDRLAPISSAMTAIGRRRLHRTVRVCLSTPPGSTIPRSTCPVVRSMAPTITLTTKAASATAISPATMAMRRRVTRECSCARASTGSSAVSARVVRSGFAVRVVDVRMLMTSWC